MENLLEVSNLQVSFRVGNEDVVSVNDVSFQLKPGETVGIVGESGCGKSVTSMAIMQLLGKRGRIQKGEILFKGENISQFNEEKMRHIRGNEIAMIFQDPLTTLNPVYTIGDQMMEGIKLHLKMNKKEARKYAIEMLKKVEIPRAESIIDEYPHALSGGMRQRVMIAMMMSCEPRLLIADEPTTALDVTIQAQILELMKNLSKESDTSIILITHDLGVVAEMADRVIVMYAGQVVEEADVFTLFDYPKHPYTQGLLKSIPEMDIDRNERLYSIQGTVPSLLQMPTGCRFHARCPKATEKCLNEQPELLSAADEHLVRCWHIE